jgi:endonuclease/exonuclease/phosphatase family metal-dependent hydrolase
MRWVSLILLVVACGESRVLAPAPQPRTPSQMRVMSYNVNFGVAGDPSTIEAIEAAQPDIVFLQETNEVWQRTMVAKLGTMFAHHRFTHPESWPAGGMGLLSKYPVVSLQHLEPPPGGYFFAWRVVLDTKLGRIQVLNVHLRPPMSDSGSWVVGYFSTRWNRLTEIEHHFAALDPKLPTIALGDFNEEADGRAIQFLADRGFSNALAHLGIKTRTWEWPIKGMTLRFQLDHILHDDHFVPVTGAVVEAGRSDHKPLWVDFERIDP